MCNSLSIQREHCKVSTITLTSFQRTDFLYKCVTCKYLLFLIYDKNNEMQSHRLDDELYDTHFSIFGCEDKIFTVTTTCTITILCIYLVYILNKRYGIIYPKSIHRLAGPKECEKQAFL